MPRFSIVIPTYNRAKLISRSIESALDQTHPDVEVIVTDNASTDDTREVVARYGERVRYHRNESNLGLWGNFGVGPGLATGEYFSWLTDDDYIRRDFVARAIQALSAENDINMYVCWAAYTPSPRSVKKYTTIHGPLLPVDWLAPDATIIDGLEMVPFMFFESQAMPPAVALRTQAAREGVKSLVPDCLQFNEFILTATIAAMGRVAIDPWIGVLHIHHDKQAHLLAANCDPLDVLRQKRIHADFCQKLMSPLSDGWIEKFRETLQELSAETRMALIANANPIPGNPTVFWGTAPKIALELRDMVIESLPEKERHEVQNSLLLGTRSRARIAVERVITPRVYKTIKAAQWAWNSH